MISCKMRRELAWCASVRLRKQRWRIYTIHRPITFAKKKLLVQFHFNTLKLKSVRLIIERVSLLALLFNFFLSWTKLEIFLSFLFNIFLKNCFFFKKKYIYKKREKKRQSSTPAISSLSLSPHLQKTIPLFSLSILQSHGLLFLLLPKIHLLTSKKLILLSPKPSPARGDQLGRSPT